LVFTKSAAFIQDRIVENHMAVGRDFVSHLIRAFECGNSSCHLSITPPALPSCRYAGPWARTFDHARPNKPDADAQSSALSRRAFQPIAPAIPTYAESQRGPETCRPENASPD